MAASAAGMGPTPKVSRGIDAEASSRPKRRAREGSIRPEGNGRRLVRGMRASLSRSRNMFSTLAAAATSAVPASVSRTREFRTRTVASQRPAAAVKTTDPVMRGLVSSRYALPAGMASRSRIGVPLREVRLVRLLPHQLEERGPAIRQDGFAAAQPGPQPEVVDNGRRVQQHVLGGDDPGDHDGSLLAGKP